MAADTGQFYLTYNLFVAPACILVLGLILNYVIKGYITKLSNDADARTKDREKINDEYRATLASIQSCVTSIKVGMEKKVDRKEHDEHCLKTVDDVWKRVNNHGHTFNSTNMTVGRVIIEGE